LIYLSKNVDKGFDEGHTMTGKRSMGIKKIVQPFFIKIAREENNGVVPLANIKNDVAFLHG